MTYMEINLNNWWDFFESAKAWSPTVPCAWLLLIGIIPCECEVSVISAPLSDAVNAQSEVTFAYKLVKMIWQ